MGISIRQEQMNGACGRKLDRRRSGRGRGGSIRRGGGRGREGCEGVRVFVCVLGIREGVGADLCCYAIQGRVGGGQRKKNTDNE